MNKYLLNGLIDFDTYEKCEAFRKTLGRGEPDIQLKEDGVGGISMISLAEIFIDKGFSVSGSDSNHSEDIKKLEKGT